MEKTTYTVALDNKCCVCHGTIKAGTKAVVTKGECYVDIRHHECPKLAPMENPEKRVIQGWDKKHG